jgi:glycosyltransferase involved in cell wall biosynthesis
MPKKPFFSIVIPTLNEEKYLPSLLKDLNLQTYQDFEVIHVDGRSDDKTIEKSSSFDKKLNLKIEQVKKRNVSFQRNIGANIASGKWIIFMDADNRLPKYFLQGVKYNLEKHPKVDGFTCYINHKNYEIQHKPLIASINIFTELANSLSATAFGTLIGVRKKICHKIKFNEKISFTEDVEFAKSLVKNNYKFKVFREPTYVYSLRRLKKEGALKMIGPTTKAFIKNLGVDGFESNKDYPMQGGDYYQTKKPEFFQNFDNFIKTATKKQLQQARKILKQIKEFEM